MENGKFSSDSEDFHHIFEVNSTIKDANLIVLHRNLTEETQPTYWNSGWHDHNHCEIIIMLAGEEEIQYENSKISISSGNICIIPKKMSHCCTPMTESQRRSSLLISLEKKKEKIFGQEQLLFHILHDLINRRSAPLVLKNCIHLCKEFEDMLQSLGQENALIGILFKFQLPFLVIRCLNEAYRLFPEFELPRISDRSLYNIDSDNVRNYLIDQFIYNNYQRKPPIEELANHIHLGVRQTRRELIKHYGIGYTEVINLYRIKKAKQMLLNHEKIDHIADALGFDSVSGFRKAFQRATGMNPTQFLKSTQKE